MRRNLLRVRSIFAPRPGFATLGLAERQPRGHTDVVPHDPGQRREISFLFDLFAASHRVRALLGQTMADAGLRPDEYAIYSAVQVAGTLTISELARMAGIPLTTASDYVRTMATRGHARRSRNPADSRASPAATDPSSALTTNGHRVDGTPARARPDGPARSDSPIAITFATTGAAG